MRSMAFAASRNAGTNVKQTGVPASLQVSRKIDASVQSGLWQRRAQYLRRSRQFLDTEGSESHSNASELKPMKRILGAGGKEDSISFCHGGPFLGIDGCIRFQPKRHSSPRKLDLKPLAKLFCEQCGECIPAPSIFFPGPAGV